MCINFFLDNVYTLILGVFCVSWVNDRWLLLTPSEVLICWRTAALLVVVRGVLVSCMTVLWMPLFPELASFASKSARAFCSRGTCTNSNIAKVSFRIWTYSRYTAIWGSLAWYSPVTCHVTNRESLLASCSHRLTQPSFTSKVDGGSSYLLVDFALSLGREWIRWNRGGPTCWLHSDDQLSTGIRNSNCVKAVSVLETTYLL